MNIGEASAASGVSSKMIRYYESIGLLAPPPRRDNRYRDYGGLEIHELRFIGRARALGFSIKDIGALLALWRDRTRPSKEVRDVAEGQLAELDARIAHLQGMAAALRHLIGACRGDSRPECPILDELGGSRGPSRTAPAPGA